MTNTILEGAKGGLPLPIFGAEIPKVMALPDKVVCLSHTWQP